MSLPIVLQLYTVREPLRHDAATVLRRIADIGYVGIEAGLTDQNGEPETVRLARSLGLQVPSVMTSLPLDTTKEVALDMVASLGCKYVGFSWYPPEKLKTVDDILVLCELLNQAATVARRHGLEFFYHNHWFECEPIFEGRTAWEIILEHTDPAVLFELDIYWAQTGGADPAALVKRGGKRVPLLHIKDGPAVRGKPMVAAGEGAVNIPAVIRAGEGATQWLMVELDECATDIWEAVEKSYRYLAENGFGHGGRD